MARLAAVEKGLYYPTQDRVLKLLGKVLPAQPVGLSLLDPCCGEGRAAQFLANLWKAESYGIELSQDRAEKAQQRLDHVLQGSMFRLSDEAQFDILFLNPPYDIGMDEKGESFRQEVQFLRRSLAHLKNRGLCILVVPESILLNNRFYLTVNRSLMGTTVLRYPEPEYSEFKQYILIGKKAPAAWGGKRFGRYYNDTQLSSIETLTESAVPQWLSLHWKIEAPPIENKVEFELNRVDPAELAPDLTQGVYSSPQWEVLTGSSVGETPNPLMAPRPGHQAMLLVSGALNGTELSNGFLIKGGSDKILVKQEKEEADVETERIVSRLSTLDLSTGEFETWRTDQEPAKTETWLAAHGKELTQAIHREYQPFYDGSVDAEVFSPYTPPGVLPGKDSPQFLHIQQQAALASAKWWKSGNKSVLISGEMGLGKSLIAILATSLSAFHKTVVICPSHLVKKWIREANTVVGGKVACTAKHLSEVDRFFEDPSLRYLVLSKERAKLGARWRPAFLRSTRIHRYEKEEWYRDSSYGYDRRRFVQKSKKYTVCSCPRCGQAIKDSEGDLVSVDWFKKVKRKCPECDEQLWQSKPISKKGTKRWALAKYINQRFGGRFALIIDEAHQYSASSTDQSRAVQLLGSACHHLVAMTGTLYGGRASALFYLLYKIDPTFRALYKHHECAKFVKHHGLFETKYPIDERTSIYGYRRVAEHGRVKEIPGVNPAMISLLLHYTIFIKLKDLGYDLPPYTEEVEIVAHDHEVLQEVTNMASDVLDVLRRQPKLLGAYLMACLGYPDNPCQEESITYYDEELNQDVEVAHARAFPSDTIWPKDEKLAEIAQEEKEQGRQVLVFFTQTGKRNPQPRVKAHLESKGLRVAILDSSVPPGKREGWVHKKIKEGFDVMLTNGRLVETGLDLLFAKTIVQYSTEYSVPTLRQSTRRSWRLGQTEPVRVIYLAYQGTMQEVAMNLIAKKMRASELVEGDDLGGLSEWDDSGHDLLLELARETAKKYARAA